MAEERLYCILGRGHSNSGADTLTGIERSTWVFHHAIADSVKQTVSITESSEAEK